MNIFWSPASQRDLLRLYEFLEPKNPQAAQMRLQLIIQVGNQLTAFPRAAEMIEEFLPREVRRRMIAEYEIRYEIKGDRIHILRIWHQREERLH